MRPQFSLLRLMIAVTCLALAFAAFNLDAWECEAGFDHRYFPRPALFGIALLFVAGSVLLVKSPQGAMVLSFFWILLWTFFGRDWM